MAVDEELLRPSREHLAALGNKIKEMEAETHNKVLRFAKDDDELAKKMWRDFYRAVEPLRREILAVGQVIANYYALQTDLPPIHMPSAGQGSGLGSETARRHYADLWKRYRALRGW